MTKENFTKEKEMLNYMLKEQTAYLKKNQSKMTKTEKILIKLLN